EIAEDGRRSRRHLGVREHRFELRQLSIGCGVRIDVRIEYTKVIRSKRNGRAYSQPGSPGAFMPRQIDSCDVFEGQATQQSDARITLVIKRDLFLKVEPPLTCLWEYAMRNAGRHTDPAHRELTCHVAP